MTASKMNWAGWELSVAARQLIRPAFAYLSGAEAAVLADLMAAGGGVRSRRSLGAAIEASGESKSGDPENMVGMVVHKINKKARCAVGGIANVRRFGYRLLPVGLAPLSAAELEEEARRELVVALLKDELEATGPHARAVARQVEKIYSEKHPPEVKP